MKEYWTYFVAAFVLGACFGSWVTDRIYAPLIPICRELIERIRAMTENTKAAK